MSAADELKRDAMKAMGSYYAKPVGLTLLVLCGFFLAYVHGRRSVVTDQKRAAAIDTVRITEKAKAVAADTVVVRLKAQARVDTLVRVLSDTTVLINHDTITPPPLIVERITTDDRTIAALRSYIVADSASDRAKAILYAIKPPRSHWGLGAGLGYACNQKGCGPGLSVGIVWRF